MKAFVVIEYPTDEYLNELNEQEILEIEIPYPFIVGVFNKLSLAKEIAEELAVKNEGKYEYIIEKYQVNDVYFKSEEDVEREVSECIEEMVKEGLLDYKIGEDGDFYFEVTDKGVEEDDKKH